MRWLLILLLACFSVTAQINLKVTSPLLPVNWQQAAALGVLRSGLLVVRAGAFSGMTLMTTWYSYKYFGFLELFVATGLTYILAVAVSYFWFAEPITWLRICGVAAIAGGVGLFFAK
jgi:multidrug transporter EmrE-like cation transporter